MGESIKSCEKTFHIAFKYFMMSETDPNSKTGKFSDYITIYDDVLRLVSLAVIFNITKELSLKLKTIIDKHKGNDYLMDLILKNKLNLTQISNKKHYPKVYKNLYLILEEEKNREQLMITYMENWYKSNRLQHWYNLHKKSKVNGPCPFYGYWALEAKAVAKVLDLDEAKFRLIDYYPNEL